MNGSIMKIAGEEALRQNIVKTKEYVQQHSGGGHTIITASSLPMAGQPNLQFEGVHVENVGQAGQGKTVIKPQFHVCATKAEWDAMSPTEQNDPLVYWVRPWANSDAFATDRTPVGTVISVAGTYDSSLHKFPTDDYLVCNGASPVYINQYPKLAEYFEQAYGTKFYFNVGQLDPQDGTFAIPDWSADFPENGILCIKAQISSTAITYHEIDQSGIYAGEDKVPSCARVAEIEGIKTTTITVPDAWCYNTSNNKIRFFKNGKTVMMIIPTTKIAVAGTITNIGITPSDFCPVNDVTFQLWNTNDRNASNINILQIFVTSSGTVQFYGSGAVNTPINAGNAYVYMAK